MLTKRTYSVPPSVRNHNFYLEDKLLQSINAREGFVTKVHYMQIDSITISHRGFYIYEISADIECFLPKIGTQLRATVVNRRGTAHVALANKRLNIIFHSENPHEKGSEIMCVIKEVQFQLGTWRATGELM